VCIVDPFSPVGCRHWSIPTKPTPLVKGDLESRRVAMYHTRISSHIGEKGVGFSVLQSGGEGREKEACTRLACAPLVAFTLRCRPLAEKKPAFVLSWLS
jgi:hypothetical protein